MTRTVLFLSVLALSSITIRAQNWPSFRGPNASGVAEGTNPPTSWDIEKSQNVLWKTRIPGLSHASPIIWGNQIFVITAVSSDANAGFKAKDRGIDLANDDAKHTWMIFALDKRNGRVLWTDKPYEGVPRAKRHVKATQANSTPVTDGRYVVALFGSEGLACYDTNGKLLWKQDLGVLNPGLWDDKESSWGHASSPIIYRDLVIVQADGHKQSFIAAFNLKDGKQAWRVERNEITSWTTPSIYQGKDRTELIANGGRYIRGYDPLTGKELWRFSDNDTQVKMQAPQIANDLIYITGGYPAGRAMYVFRPGANGDISLRSGEDTNAFLAWRSSKGSPYTPTPIVYGDQFYVVADNGVLSSYDAKTGALIYQQRLPSSFSASPVAADGKLYLASEDGDVFVVKAGRQFELLQKNVMGQPLMATPALTQGMLIVRADDVIYALGERKIAEN
ncbi:MAG TPA: PQQ-binding-like beta-propeller repeat protein [Pyrinomonadaceae bacterium]|jgi:outer membrane protein assembly factor BamB|nr:PQQ-binding-like beta-propeller repeat protein [Pyrinomonadaceae bacterium]